MKTWYNSKVFTNFVYFSLRDFFALKCPHTPKSYTTYNDGDAVQITTLNNYYVVFQ